jgi:hypothetical protein
MPLPRASCQPSATLEGFYQKLASSPDSVSSNTGAQMLSLLPRLAEVCAPFHVWHLTSLALLWLLAADDWRSPWLVCITAMPEGYRIHYLTMDAEAPWPEATVEGVASDEPTACRLVLSAMIHSCGWNAALMTWSVDLSEMAFHFA